MHGSSRGVPLRRHSSSTRGCLPSANAHQDAAHEQGISAGTPVRSKVCIRSSCPPPRHTASDRVLSAGCAATIDGDPRATKQDTITTHCSHIDPGCACLYDGCSRSGCWEKLRTHKREPEDRHPSRQLPPGERRIAGSSRSRRIWPCRPDPDKPQVKDEGITLENANMTIPSASSFMRGHMIVGDHRPCREHPVCR